MTGAQAGKREPRALQLALVLGHGYGNMNNQGTHQLDVARWAIEPRQTHPTRVMVLGGRFQWNDHGETPNPMLKDANSPGFEILATGKV